MIGDQDELPINLGDLRLRLVQRATALALAMSGAAAIIALAGLPASRTSLSLSLAAIGLCILVWVSVERYPTLARHLLAWGAVAVLAAAMWLSDTAWLPLLALPLVFLAAWLVTGGEVLVALLFGGYASWLTATGLREYPLIVLVLALVSGLALARLTVSTMYTALQVAWAAQRQSDEALAQARDRQAELGAALKSLELASYQLETANRNLFVARRQTEEARRTKEQFAANISHELRTPLNVILGFSEMMYVSPEVYGVMAWPTALRQDVYQVYRSSRHLLSMIDDVLELSRFELARFALLKEPTDMGPLLAGAVDIVAGLFRGRPLRLETTIEPGLPAVEIDRTRIRQVVINLLTNARNYTKAGTVRLSARAAAGEVIISVSDTGPGIPANKVPYIFDAFFQVDSSLRREQGGAGLGLAISKRFVESHEGRIWVESEEGVGTTVHFSLPLPDCGTRTAYPVETQSNEPSARLERPRVAVIDPDPSVAGLLGRYLEQYDIVPVDDMQMLSRELTDNPPRLAIVNVPPGQHSASTPTPATAPPPRDGHADVTLAHTHALAEDITFVECSLPSHTWVARALSISACLTKPITADQLIHEIDQIGDVRDVVIVDDDRGFAQLVERMLAATQRGYRVRLAFDGQEGLEVMRQQAPDLLLLDLAMPVMDGFQMLTQLQEDASLSQVPVILLTVTSYAEDAMMKYGSHLSLTRQNGLRLAEVLRCLQAVTKVLYE